MIKDAAARAFRAAARTTRCRRRRASFPLSVALLLLPALVRSQRTASCAFVRVAVGTGRRRRRWRDLVEIGRDYRSFASCVISPSPTTKATAGQRIQRSNVVLFDGGGEGDYDDAVGGDYSSTSSLAGLRVGIVGGGPSGLLLAHKLQQYGADRVVVYEEREKTKATNDDGRPWDYTIGIGARGRAAIQSVVFADGVDEGKGEGGSASRLWRSVSKRGFVSERFDLYTPVPFPKRIRLRNDSPSSSTKPSSSSSTGSLLIFMSSLCDALAEGLGPVVDLRYGTRVSDLNVRETTLTASPVAGYKETNTNTIEESFDLIVGCDGTKSIVRASLIDAAKCIFNVTSETLPGIFRTLRLSRMPPLMYDATAVSVLLPRKGGPAVALVPTSPSTTEGEGVGCILFSGGGSNGANADPLFSSSSRSETELAALVLKRFPKLDGVETEMAKRLASLNAAAAAADADAFRVATSIRCNTYHVGCTALVGDAAHATGASSGQGANSAMIDAVALSKCLRRHYDRNNKRDSVQRALLAYSEEQVPEGIALYELSFGKPRSMLKRMRLLGKTLRDALFKGAWGIGDIPLHTKLTTTVQPFAEIRRRRDTYYDDPFPDESCWSSTISDLHKKMLAALTKTAART